MEPIFIVNEKRRCIVYYDTPSSCWMVPKYPFSILWTRTSSLHVMVIKNHNKKELFAVHQKPSDCVTEFHI